MDVVERKVESQVQFWSLLGPFFVLLSIAVLLFKVSPHWYFPVSALLGIPLCVKWKMKGMAAALCCLLLLSGIGYQSLELDDRYWHVGLALAMAFSFIVLTLSLEEVQVVLGKLYLESQSRLDNFLLLDEKWKTAEHVWANEREISKSEVLTLTQEMARVQEDKQTFYKLAQLAKDELIQVRGQHELLLQDLLYKKQQIFQLYERLEETEMTIQEFVNSDAEKQRQIFTERVTHLEREKEALRAKIVLDQSQGQIYQQEIDYLQQKLKTYQDQTKLSLVEHQHLHSDSKRQIQVLTDCVTCLEQERETLRAKIALDQIKEHTHQQEQDQLYQELQASQEREKLFLIEHQHLHSDSKKQIQVLADCVNCLEQEKETLRAKLALDEEQGQIYQQQKEQLYQELQNYQEREKLYLVEKQQLQQDKAEIHTLQTRYHLLEQEKNTLFQAKIHLQQQYEQLRGSETQQRQTIQHAHSRIQELEAKLTKEEHQRAAIQLDQKSCEEQLIAYEKQLKQREEQYTIDFQYLQSQLEEKQEKLIYIQQQNQKEQEELKRENKEAQERYQEVRENYWQTRQELETKKDTLGNVQQKVAELSCELNEKHTFVHEIIQHKQKLEELNLQLEQALQEAQVQLQLQKQKRDVARQQREKLPYTPAPGNTRHIEAMYVQLKEQFQEKCRVLDATRRELFQANEFLLKWQKEEEEERIFNQTPNEKSLQRHCLKIERYYEKLQQYSQQEINELTQLIEQLLKQMISGSKTESWNLSR